MKFEDLVEIYENKKKQYGKETYRHISEILETAKKKHKKDFEGIDHEQSWKSFKGKNLEKLIEYIITEEVQNLGLAIVNGNVLERKLDENLTEELCQIKRNLCINYGKYGMHLPDADLIICA